MIHVPSPRVQRGVSMIEVLVAVLIFTVGLIGLGGLLITATKSNASAYVRTQVTFLANNMADRMRANPPGTLERRLRFRLISDHPDAAGLRCDDGLHA